MRLGITALSAAQGQLLDRLADKSEGGKDGHSLDDLPVLLLFQVRQLVMLQLVEMIGDSSRVRLTDLGWTLVDREKSRCV